MPTYRINVTNQTFSATSEHELADFEQARKQGVGAALAIGSEEVSNGLAFFGAEVSVEEGNRILGRFVVAIGSSPLSNPARL